MSSPSAVPTDVFCGVGVNTAALWQSAFRSMASPVRVQLGGDVAEPRQYHRLVRTVFEQVDEQCTRFDPRSDLMRANAAGDAWCAVGEYCFDALRIAHEAHAVTDGWFDPRVLRTLVALGYDKTLPFEKGVDVGERALPTHVDREPWQPRFDRATRRVQVGAEPIDLGGIGKGLALRWAADELRAAGCDIAMIDAGGDCVCSGAGPDGAGWRIGVEDPHGGDRPVAVLESAGGACATSSVRLLSWRAGSRTVHHLIDPRTGRPGGAGLRSVTVYGTDAALAEVWSKVLFLRGAADIATAADTAGLAALWIREDGTLDMTPAMAPFVIWRRR